MAFSVVHGPRATSGNVWGTAAVVKYRTQPGGSFDVALGSRAILSIARHLRTAFRIGFCTRATFGLEAFSVAYGPQAVFSTTLGPRAVISNAPG